MNIYPKAKLEVYGVACINKASNHFTISRARIGKNQMR